MEDKRKYIELLQSRHTDQLNEIKEFHENKITHLEAQLSSNESKVNYECVSVRENLICFFSDHHFAKIIGRNKGRIGRNEL